MKISKDEIFNVLEEDRIIETDRYPGKHGVHYKTYVLPRDGKWWQFTLEFHPYDGINRDEDIQCFEVIPIERTITSWEKVACG